MKVPIPDDWNGQDWFCVQLQWPDSPQFVGILLGLLSQMTRGRFWDEATGSILGIQDIAQSVFSANFPFVDCAGNGVDPPGPEIIYRTMTAIESECDMGSLCGYNPKAFKIENGLLYVRDFCGEWVAIGALQAPGDLPPDSIWDDDPPGGGEFSACGKVDAWATAFENLCAAMWEYYDEEGIYEQKLREAVPNATLGRTAIYLSLPQMYILSDLIGLSNEINTPDFWQEVRCRAVRGVLATGTTTEAEMEYMSNSVRSLVFDMWESLTAELVWGFCRRMGDIIGINDQYNIANLGAINHNADCTCPGVTIPQQATDPDAQGWYLGENWADQFTKMTETDNTWDQWVATKIAPHDVYGHFLKMTGTPGSVVVRMGATAITGGTYPPHDATLWTDSSGDLTTLNLTYPLISRQTEAIRLSLAAQRGFTGAIDGGTIGIDGVTINPPPAGGEAGNNILAVLRSVKESQLGVNFHVQELRFIHNINSPSHQT
jgi:hypothetical protein